MTCLVLAVKARIYRDGLVTALSSRAGLVVAAATGDSEGTVAALQMHKPDILLADVALDNALGLMPAVRAMASEVKAIALAMNTDDNEVALLDWAEAGAVGFVTCDNSLDELIVCVDAAMRGELACSPRMSAALLRRVCELAARRAQPTAAPAALTQRQTQILHLLNLNMSNKQIARELGIELATVKNHVHYLLERLQVHHRREAVAAMPISAHGPLPPIR